MVVGALLRWESLKRRFVSVGKEWLDKLEAQLIVLGLKYQRAIRQVNTAYHGSYAQEYIDVENIGEFLAEKLALNYGCSLLRKGRYGWDTYQWTYRRGLL